MSRSGYITERECPFFVNSFKGGRNKRMSNSRFIHITKIHEKCHDTEFLFGHESFPSYFLIFTSRKFSFPSYRDWQRLICNLLERFLAGRINRFGMCEKHNITDTYCVIGAIPFSEFESIEF